MMGSYRVSLDAAFDKIRQTIKIDITGGDLITPRAIEYSYKLMLEDRAINLMAYNIETVLSEKIETIITRGVTNTRMRDYYDIYILTSTQQYDTDTLLAAFGNTARQRGTTEQLSNIAGSIKAIEDSSIMIGLWQKYQGKYSYAEGISWTMAMDALRKLAARLQ